MQIIHVLSRSWVRLRAIATYSTTAHTTEISIPANFRGHLKQLDFQEACKFLFMPFSLFFWRRNIKCLSVLELEWIPAFENLK